MFEKLNTLRAERDNLSARLTLVNNEIAQEFARIDADIVAKRRELGALVNVESAKRKGGRPKGFKLTPEQRARLSASIRASRARRAAEQAATVQ